MASVQGELKRPDDASSYGLAGTVVVGFVRAQARIDIQDDGIDAPPVAGVVTAGSSQDAERRAARKAFQTQLRQAADLALKRFDKPAGVPADWRVEARHVFAPAR